MFEDDEKKEITITLTGHSSHPERETINKYDTTIIVYIDHYREPNFERIFFLNNRMFIYDTENMWKKFEVLDDGTEVLTMRIPKKRRDLVEPNMFKALVVDHSNRTEYIIQFIGANLQTKDLSVQVVKNDTLKVRAQNDQTFFVRRFQIPPNHQEKQTTIKFATHKDGKKQNLIITIPKNRNIIHIPITVESEKDSSAYEKPSSY